MKNRARKLLAALGITALLSTINSQLSIAFAEGTAFTYQGQLQNGGALASGTFNLKFTLFDTNITGTAVAGPVTNSDVAISNGLFTVTIDFGASPWNGQTNWLEIAVETNGASAFTQLSPRQRVTPTPYAITAENLNGTVDSSGLSGTYGSMVTLSNPGNQFTGAFTGDGSALTNVNAAALGGLSASNFWQLGGNTIASSSQFIGTLNNEPFDVYVDGIRGLRLIVRTDATGEYSNAPNVIGGSSVNLVKTGVVGGTVGGGGAIDTNGISYPNQINADFGTISGGSSNYVSTNAVFAFTGGGFANFADSAYGTIGGGIQNLASGFATTVAGGQANTATEEAGTVGGGVLNNASGSGALVGGGAGNTSSGLNSTVAGGFFNSASGDYSVVAGGDANTNDAPGSFIGGGGYDGTTTAGNVVFANAATICGGLENQIPVGSRYAFIGGGVSNSASAYFAALGGGVNNLASGRGAFVGGGGDDGYHTTGPGAFPNGNTASGGGAVVAGGWGNTASGLDSSLTGGYISFAEGDFSTVTGGYRNYADGDYSIVAGGIANEAVGQCSFAAGNNAYAGGDGAFVWSDDSGAGLTNTAPDQFMARATGGFFFYTGTGGAGAKLTSTSWIAICDRNAKKNFQPVNTVAVLDKLAAVPIEQWNYKWEKDSDTPNIGPMAQDFKAAFYPGRDDKGISTLEFDGVELAAIQGLNKKLEGRSQKEEDQIQELKTENAQLKEKNDSLEKRLEALEEILLKQKSN